MIEASIDTITITADIGKGYPVRGDKGENAYVHLAYANSTDGKDFTLTPEDGKTYEYLGQYTDNTETASTEWSAYKWSWLTDEASRQAAETARTAAETARVSAEESRDSAEKSRQTAESERVKAESERSAQETARIEAESARAASEEVRIANEENRTSDEADRRDAENRRASAERARESSESERAESESARQTQESARVTAEQNRADAESARAAAETARASAETDRKSAESARISAETKRETDSGTATQAANTAATNAQNIADTVQAKLDAGDFKGEKGDQGEQGIQGIQGEKGDPGSDAEVTKANIESALGSLPKPNGNFELLHDITVSETGLSSIAINENITALAIIFTTSTTENNNITAGFVTSQNRGFNVYFSDGYAVQFIYVNIVNAQPISLWARKASTSEYTPLETLFMPISQCRSINWPITHFTKCTVTTGRTDGFAIGTKLQIYGVRA